jgi:alpha-1,4-digalacturonate transport system permease protein
MINYDKHVNAKKRNALFFKCFTYTIIILFTFYTLFPLFWMLTTALKPSYEVLSIPPKFFPSQIMLGNIKKALSMAPFDLYFRNSLIVTVSAVTITVFINLLAGFSFAKYNFKGKRFLFMIVLSTLMIPLQITMVPNFIIMSKLNWLNTYQGLIIPQCAEAFGLFLSRQFLSEIPDELLEAARVDGATEFKIFRSIIIPSSKPLIAVLVIFTFMWRWNDFLWPLIVLSDRKYYTVQLGLSMLQGLNYVNWNDLMAASLIVTLPVVLVFILFQKYFVQGVTTTGLKD